MVNFGVSEPGEGTRFEVRLPLCEKNERYVRSPTAAFDEMDDTENLISIK